jgi:hypothetical protein
MDVARIFNALREEIIVLTGKAEKRSANFSEFFK